MELSEIRNPQGRVTKHNGFTTGEEEEWRQQFLVLIHMIASCFQESIGVVSKAMSSSNKGSMGSLFRTYMHHKGMFFRGGHIPQHAEFKMCITEHAQLKVIVQEAKMADRNTSGHT
jgi:hypothetical protein